MKLSITLLLLTIISMFSWTQVPIGEWQDYLSFSEVHSVAKVNNKVYAATSIGLFSYDTDEYILQKHTKINGLNDLEVTSIAAIPNTNKLFVGYENGNIDIINDQSIDNIPDLKMKSMNNSKRINHISFINDKAFCSTDFGILVVDYNNLEISDFYYIGDNATNLIIYQTCVVNDSIYVATEKGVRGAPVNSNLLSFYETWKVVSEDRLEYTSIVAVNDKLITAKINNNNHKILEYKTGSWNELFAQSNFINLGTYDNGFFLTSSNEIKLYNNQLVEIETVKEYNIEDKNITPNFSSIYIDDNNTKWIGDSSNGLIQMTQIEDSQILPDGPYSNKCFKILATENALMVAAGTYEFDPSPTPAEFSLLRDNKWKHLNSTTEPKFVNKYSICDIVVNPLNESQIFLASCSNGIFELNNDTVSYLYDEYNSALEKVWKFELVGGLAMDDDGNLYANNQEVNPMIVVKPLGVTTKPEEWISYYYMPFVDEDGNPDGDSKSWLRQMIRTSWGHFWSVSVHDLPGIFIFNTNNTVEDSNDDEYRSPKDGFEDSRHQLIEIWDEDGQNYTLNPLCLAEDKNGYIWMGTNSGILVYYRPRDVFSIEKPVASRIKVARNDGSGLADYLLDNEIINCISVDGANRKWIGTQDNGIFLVSSDGTKTLKEFNIDNSPLISNLITSISINPKTGDVLIGTDKGMVSYRGTASEGEDSFSNVYAFPNPVHPNYDGVITVKGLVDNSSVRITDISGKIVYEAISTGGQLVWNGKNTYNEKVKSGVYLVFATNKDGSESVATKIMIIN